MNEAYLGGRVVTRWDRDLGKQAENDTPCLHVRPPRRLSIIGSYSHRDESTTSFAASSFFLRSYPPFALL